MEDLEGEGLVEESNDSECGFVVDLRPVCPFPSYPVVITAFLPV